MMQKLRFQLEGLAVNALSVPRRLTVASRALPSFLIIGAQRCGTTSLFNYLIRHPLIAEPLIKEIHYFDINYHKGLKWYRAYFPRNKGKINVITGESSPYYLFHPLVPERVHVTLPDVKLIVLLRNPVDRAYSHYFHEIKRGRENLSFVEAIEREKKRLEGEKDRMLKDGTYYSYNHHRYSYISRGIYVEQLGRWMNYFRREQFLLLRSEEFYEDPLVIVNRVFEFMGLEYLEENTFRKYNKASYPPMEEATQRRLNEYFRPYNERLEDLTGEHFYWNKK